MEIEEIQQKLHTLTSLKFNYPDQNINDSSLIDILEEICWHLKEIENHQILTDAEITQLILEIEEREQKMETQQYDETFGAVIAAIETETKRQLGLWGTDFDDKNTANDWCAYICNYVANGAYAGRTEKYTPERFAEHLKKAAGLCISAIAAIKRNGDCASRHYEKLPHSGAKTNA